MAKHAVVDRQSDPRAFDLRLERLRRSASLQEEGVVASFGLHLMRRGLFVEEAPWIPETKTYLEERYHELPRELQERLDLLDDVVPWCEVREEFLDGTAMRMELDRVLAGNTNLTDFGCSCSILSQSVEL